MGNNPLRFADPNGLFSSDVHQEMTHRLIPNWQFAKLVSDVDWIDGSQDPDNAEWHAMGGSEQGAGNAKDAFDAYIRAQIATCNADGLARALHAAQDRAARGHKGHQPWNGGSWFFGFPGWAHAIPDAFPSADEWKQGMQNSRDIIAQFKSACKCSL